MAGNIPTKFDVFWDARVRIMVSEVRGGRAFIAERLQDT